MAVTGPGNDDATFTMASLSYRIHNDTQQNMTIHRNSNNASTTLTTSVGLTDNLITVTDETLLYSTLPTLDDPQVAWIGTERILYHGVNASANQLVGVLRGTNGTHAQAHSIGAKVFDGGLDQVVPSSNIYWVNSATTSYETGAATQGFWAYNGNGNVHFADLVDTTFVTVGDGADPVVVGDTLRVTDGFNSQIENSYYIKDLIAQGEVSVITVDAAGTGYSVGDNIDLSVMNAALGSSGAVMEVGGIDVNGGITYVYVSNRGSGYGFAGSSFPITGQGDGNATISVTTGLEGVVLAQGGDIVSVDGIVAENFGVLWTLDRALPGGLHAATTTAATFMQAEQGNVLPISLSP